MRRADRDREAVDASLLDEAHGVLDVRVDDLGRTGLAVAVVRPDRAELAFDLDADHVRRLDDLACVSATFSSNGWSDASIMTEVNPDWIAVIICSNVPP